MLGPTSSIYYDKVNRGDLREDTAQAVLAEKLDDVYEKLHAPFWQKYLSKQIKGIYIVGNVGRGKTYLMSIFYEAAKVSKQRYHYHLFMKNLHEELLKYRKNSWAELAKHFYVKGSLLCLDEFQLTDMGDLMILAQFLKRFNALGGVLITTSNQCPEEFDLPADDHRCDEFFSFLRKELEFFSIEKGPDYRIKGKETCRRVFVDYKQITSKSDFFSRNQRKGLKECIYSFHSICEEPVGIAFYTELLSHCDAIVITDCPQLSDENENSLIRFIKFIDLLYESPVSLFMYTSVDLKEIYIGSKYQKAFQRTLSRLYEITSR